MLSHMLSHIMSHMSRMIYRHMIFQTAYRKNKDCPETAFPYLQIKE